MGSVVRCLVLHTLHTLLSDSDRGGKGRDTIREVRVRVRVKGASGKGGGHLIPFIAFIPTLTPRYPEGQYYIKSARDPHTQCISAGSGSGSTKRSLIVQ